MASRAGDVPYPMSNWGKQLAVHTSSISPNFAASVDVELTAVERALLSHILANTLVLGEDTDVFDAARISILTKVYGE